MSASRHYAVIALLGLGTADLVWLNSALLPAAFAQHGVGPAPTEVAQTAELPSMQPAPPLPKAMARPAIVPEQHRDSQPEREADQVAIGQPAPPAEDSAFDVVEADLIEFEGEADDAAKGQGDDAAKGDDAAVNPADKAITPVDNADEDEAAEPIDDGVPDSEASDEPRADAGPNPSDNTADLRDKHRDPKPVDELTQATAESFEAQRIQFDDTGSTELSRSAKQSLDAIAEQLEADAGLRVALHGHTDRRGSESANRVLSKRRARAAAKYLLEIGIDKSRIDVKGFGSAQPLASGKSNAAMQQNRRVEIKLKRGD